MSENTDQNPGAMKPGQGNIVEPLNRLTGIEIKNYRAYRGAFRLELPKGANLLIYGENGAGKSSLYETLRTFLEAPDLQVMEAVGEQTKKKRALTIKDNEHRFTTDPPSVKLEFGDRAFEWSENKNETNHTLVRLLNQGKGFLDYKALLEIHYIRDSDSSAKGHDDGIDLFPLLLNRLLPYYTFPFRGRSRTFHQGWKYLTLDVTARWKRNKKGEAGRPEMEFPEDLKIFNDALEKAIRELGERASVMLSDFGDELQADFHYEKAEFKTGPKRLQAPRVFVRPAFRKQQLADYHRFFNEAKLSALAICVFFAALKDSPATGLRMLALDDILIGLDMANRVKVIDLVHKHFADWQIFIFTYSKAWFERLKDRLIEKGQFPDWVAPWEAVVLWEEWRDQENSPHIAVQGSGDMLQMAARHLQRKDYKAAAVYARSALEALCHKTCAAGHLPVIHVLSSKQRKVEHFLIALELRLGEIVDTARRGRALELLARLKQARDFVLNRNAHFDVEEEDTLSAEVCSAIATVRDLTTFLGEQVWDGAKFHSGRAPVLLEQLNAQLLTARLLVMNGAKRQCQEALGIAHNIFWQIYGGSLGVLLPPGAQVMASAMWKAADEQGKLDAAIKCRLESFKGYLFGSVKVADFDEARFEDAAKLLEELTSPPPV